MRKSGQFAGALDLEKISVPDMQSCIDACMKYTEARLGGNAPLCWAVSIIKEPGEFCYLKQYPLILDESYDRPSDSAMWISD